MQRYFKAEEGRETLADQTAHRACKKYVGDMIHEARLQAHVDYYRSIKKEPLNSWRHYRNGGCSPTLLYGMGSSLTSWPLSWCLFLREEVVVWL